MHVKILTGITAALLFFTRPAGADGEITAISLVDSIVTISINTTVGVTYQVQYSTDLTDPDGWTNVSSARFTADSAVTTLSGSVSFNTCYFRVVRERTSEPEAPTAPPPDMPSAPPALF